MKMTTKTTAIFQICLCMISLVGRASGEMYKIHNALQSQKATEIETFDDFGNPNGRRKLLLDVGNLASINATTDTCKLIGPEYVCNIQSQISADDGTAANVQVQVYCPLDSQIAFDFRRAPGCSCGARVTHSSGSTKDCPCIVCPFGFGTSPISIDCSMREDPFIISTCSFLDCGFACNGTCEFNCKNSGPQCGFCEGNDGTAPTPAPTGLDGSTRPPSLISQSAGERVFPVAASVGTLMGACLALLAVM